MNSCVVVAKSTTVIKMCLPLFLLRSLGTFSAFKR